MNAIFSLVSSPLGYGTRVVLHAKLDGRPASGSNCQSASCHSSGSSHNAEKNTAPYRSKCNNTSNN